MNYVLIDYENVHVKSLALLRGEDFRVLVFLGPKNTKLPVDLVLAMQKLGKHAEYILLEKSGANALDFHIAYYLGILVTADPAGFFHIISKDTGFDPLIRHLQTKKILTARSASIEAMPCFSQAALDHVDANAACGTADSVQPSARATVDDMLKLAMDDLIKRKNAKPRTAKTLRNTIQAKLGKNVRATDVDAVYAALIERGHITINDTKVVYTLPREEDIKCSG